MRYISESQQRQQQQQQKRKETRLDIEFLPFFFNKKNPIKTDKDGQMNAAVEPTKYYRLDD